MTDTLTVESVPADKIQAGNNDRKTFDQRALEELAASIAANGLAQPITIRPAGENFEIVAGERRFRACTAILGWSEVPAIVRDYDDEAASRIMLIENLQREDLNPIEEAEAYRSRLETFGGSVDDLARLVGVSASHVKRRVELLTLREEIVHLVRTGQLGTSFAWRMARLDRNRQWLALQAYQADPRMGGEKFTDLCAQLHLEQSQDSMFSDDFALAAETFVVGETRPARASRSALLAALRGVLSMVDENVDMDALDPVAQSAVTIARRTLESERLKNACG